MRLDNETNFGDVQMMEDQQHGIDLPHRPEEALALDAGNNMTCNRGGDEQDSIARNLRDFEVYDTAVVDDLQW